MPEDSAREHDMLLHSIKTDIDSGIEASTMKKVKHWEIKTKKGKSVPVENNITCIDDPTNPGEPLIVASMHDVTERKAAANQERLNNAVLESIKDSLILKDTNGVIKQSNPAAQKLFG